MKTYGNVEKEESKQEFAEEVMEQEFTEEETRNQMLLSEEDMIRGLIEAADFKSDDTKRIEIARRGKVVFSFTVRPLTEDDYQRCRKQWTKKIKNKRLGIPMQGDTDIVKYRDSLIYEATIPEDRKKLWDNKQVWSALNNKGFQIMNGLDVIEYTLKAGEKDLVVEEIDSLSGFGDDLEETAKN